MDLAIEAVEVCGLLLFVDHFAHMNGHHSVWVLLRRTILFNQRSLCWGNNNKYIIQ